MATKINNLIAAVQKKVIRILFYPREFLWRTITKAVTVREGIIVYNPVLKFPNSNNRKIYNLMLSLRKEQRQLQTDFELFHLYILLNTTQKIPGDIAEVGVYKGGSAKLICETTKKRVHLFDTFEGLPESDRRDLPVKSTRGDFACTYDDVKNYLRKYKNVSIYKGLFPSSSKSIKNKKFSLVHLDVDLYESTLKSLEFFYTRMSKGGIIVCHDYGGLLGGSGGLRGLSC